PRGRRAAAVVEQTSEQAVAEMPAPESEPAPAAEPVPEPTVEAAAPANPWAPRRRYEVGPDGKVRFLDEAKPTPPPAIPVEQPAVSTEPPLSDVEAVDAEPAEPARPARGRGRRRDAAELEAVEPAVLEEDLVIAQAEEGEVFTAEAEESDLGDAEGDAVVDGEQQQARRRRRSRRGGRGRRRNGTAPDMELVGEAAEPELAEAEGVALPAVEPEPEPAQASPPRPFQPAPRERPERGGSALSPIEALVARQNVILDQLMQQQRQMARTLEQTLSAIEGKLKGTDLSHVSAMPRLAVFVDVPNIMYAAERYRVAVDFGRLLDYVSRDRTLIRASAYAPISDDPTQRLEVQRFVEPFVSHGYRIVTKPLKRFADGSIKANFDVELAMDILTMSDRLDIVSLVSGDGDFRRLVDIVASKGVRVEVVSFAQSTSAELKAVADSYIDLTQHLRDLCVPVEGDARPRVPRPKVDISGWDRSSSIDI
ncbi:MAG: NYN domain-containing protein, partial [Dehalococcoidia bacterium]